MAGVEVLAIADCVAAIVSIYKDGISSLDSISKKLKRNNKKSFSAERSLQNLEDSLILGPPAVQGQYDHDFHRLGKPYAFGDWIAREQLKDMIIELQVSLITKIRLTAVDNTPVDIEALQTVSDKSRVKAVTVLCQLYHRVANGGKSLPPLSIPDGASVSNSSPTSSVFDHGVSSPSAASSATSNNSGPLPLRSSLKQKCSSDSLGAAIAWTKRSLSTNSPKGIPYFDRRKISLPSCGKDADHPLRRQKTVATTTASEMRRNETEDPVSARTPELEKQQKRVSANLQQQNTDRENAPAKPLRTRVRRTASKFFSPDELYNNWAEQPDSSDNETFDEDTRPKISTNASSFSHSLTRQTRTPPASSVIRGPSFNDLTPNKNAALRFSTPAPSTTRLYVPSEENNYAGFCKGAWKLQLGLKKAFTLRTRTEGLKLTSTSPCWRCSKCNYEGPAASPGHLSSSSSSSPTPNNPNNYPSFDTTIRTHPTTRIRYRWTFLAKSHVYTKKHQAPGSDGSVGIFGCIFCCAAKRGPAPLFGNLDTFMEHLKADHSEFRPSARLDVLLDRTRCVVGRVAGDSEDFDVNIVPSVG